MSDFPFTIMDVAYLLRLNIRRRGNPLVVYADCPICGEHRGRMGLYPQTNTWHCFHCGESGGMLPLYGRIHGVSNSQAYHEICDALSGGGFPAESGAPAVTGTGKQPQEAPASDRAPEREIHRTLTALLALLTLTQAHKEHLRTVRGLTDEEIDGFGFKSTPPYHLCRELTKELMKRGLRVQGVPGFYVDDNGGWTVKFYQRTSGFLIPQRGVDGLLRGLQIRLDNPIRDDNAPSEKKGAKYLPLSSAGKKLGVTSGSPIHFVGDPHARVVYVTEGALKADIAHTLTGRTFAATVGANNTGGLDSKMVGQYLGSEKTGYDAILEYQMRLRLEERYKRYQKETAKWDADMALTPALPKDWGRWVDKVGIPQNFIFYEYRRGGAKTGYCTFCGKDVPIQEKPHHCKVGHCPRCRHEITYKSLGRLGRFMDTNEVSIYLIQPRPDGFVVREFWARRMYSKETYRQPEIFCSEHWRVIYDGKLSPRTYFWGVYKQSTNRWIAGEPNCNWMSPNRIYATHGNQDGRVYGKTLPHLVRNALKHTGLIEWLRTRGFTGNPDRYLALIKKYPRFEQLWKAGLPKLTEESWKQYYYEYANDDFAVVAPRGVLDILVEGDALCHCLSRSDRYWDRIETHESYILFLRRTSALNVPYYTLEVEPDGTVRQKRTKYDRQEADIESAKVFLTEWQGVINKRLSVGDLRKAAKSRILREQEFDQMRRDNVIIHTGELSGHRLVDVLTADLMEAA